MKKLWNKLVELYDLIAGEIWLFCIVNRYWKGDTENGKD